MFKVTVDDEVWNGVVGYSTPGNSLQLEFSNGQIRLLTGWVDVLVERVEVEIKVPKTIATAEANGD